MLRKFKVLKNVFIAIKLFVKLFKVTADTIGIGLFDVAGG